MDKKTYYAITIGFTIAVVSIVFISIIAVIAMMVQHDVVNPQVRQNIIDDPATTIQNRRDFHNKIGLIISADQNVLTDLNALARCHKSQCADEDRLLNEMIGVEQIRSNAINAYNAQADNPDVNKDREPWMPKHIDVKSIPADDTQAQQFLYDEIDAMQSIYNKGY